jgi:diaminopimelate epimerase
MTCHNIKRIKKTKLCTGDKTHLVEIQTRELEGVQVGTMQPAETFTTVRNQWCALETISPGVARFAKINIDEQATHIFWCDWDSDFPDIENRNHYILDNSKRYKVLAVDNVNERNEALAIQVTERGESTEEAAKA